MFFIRSNELDNPQTTEEYHASLIKRKLYLRRTYISFYLQQKKEIRWNKKKKIVELGSGGGFIKELIPNAITSDVMKLKNIDMQFSALKIPFKKESVDAFLMIDVFHHIPDVKKFLKEADRCLKKGGKIVMIEPSNTLLGGFIFKHFHHETFNKSSDWKFESKGPLSSSNLALPWIVFFRDRKKFEKLFPSLKIVKLSAQTPFRYLISGGLSLPQLLPSWTYPLVLKLENLLTPFNKFLGMFYLIEVEKL